MEFSNSDDHDDDNDKCDEELNDQNYQNKNKSMVKPNFSDPMPGKPKTFTFASDSSESDHTYFTFLPQ